MGKGSQSKSRAAPAAPAPSTARGLGVFSRTACVIACTQRGCRSSISLLREGRVRNSVRRLSAVAVLFFASSSFGQLKGPGAEQPHADGIHLDVVVTGRDGKPVQGLPQADFTVLDNGVPQKIASFKPMTGDAAPVEVIIIVDAVNPEYSTVAYERQQRDKYFLANGGKLPYLTTLAIFSDQDTEIMRGFTRNGASLSAALDRYTISLRALRRS